MHSRFNSLSPVLCYTAPRMPRDFTPQNSVQRACEQSPAAVAAWMDEDHPAIA